MTKKEINKVITFAHDKGGTGKSTNAINSAVEINKEYKLTVIDLDPKQQFTFFNSNREEPLKQFSPTSDKDLQNFVNRYKGLIIIDLGGFDSNFFRLALYLSNIIIIPLSDSDNDMHGLLDFEKILFMAKEAGEAEGHKIDCSVLASNLHHANKSDVKILQEYAHNNNFGFFNTVIRSNSLHRKMLFAGKNICEKTSGTPCINIQNFVKELKSKIEG